MADIQHVYLASILKANLGRDRAIRRLDTELALASDSQDIDRRANLAALMAHLPR
jgi:hypothetical protein